MMVRKGGTAESIQELAHKGASTQRKSGMSGLRMLQGGFQKQAVSQFSIPPLQPSSPSRAISSSCNTQSADDMEHTKCRLA